MDGLLIDWGGVLTTSVMRSFDAFCLREGLPEHTVRNAFRNDAEARRHLIDLETGAIGIREFERRLAHALKLSERHPARRLMQDVEADHAMRDAVRR